MRQPRDVTHRLKIEPHWWMEIADGRKTSELRYDDRDFQIGDQIKFINTETGMCCGYRRITHVLKNVNGLDARYVVLSLNNPDHEWQVETAEMRRQWLNTAEARVRSLKGVITKQRKVIQQLKAGES